MIVAIFDSVTSEIRVLVGYLLSFLLVTLFLVSLLALALTVYALIPKRVTTAKTRIAKNS